MAKDKTAPELVVQLQNDWYAPSMQLFRKIFNPHRFPEHFLDVLPTSAKIEVDGKFVSVQKYRGEEGSPEEEAQKADEAKKAGKPALTL